MRVFVRFQVKGFGTIPVFSDGYAIAGYAYGDGKRNGAIVGVEVSLNAVG